MKFKKIITILILTSLIIPCILIPFSNAEIEWQVSEGDEFTWVVKETNESLGFLPVNSRYEMTITSIKSVSSMGVGEATELYVDLSEYNSDTELTTSILTNQTFSTFDSGTNITTLHTPIDDHCFFIPPAYRDGFVVGLLSFYGGFFDSAYSLTTQGVFTFFGWVSSTDLLYMWMFNNKLVSDNLAVVFLDKADEFQYWLQLKTIPSISAGNIFWILLGVTTVSLIYIYRKKLKNNH